MRIISLSLFTLIILFPACKKEMQYPLKPIENSKIANSALDGLDETTPVNSNFFSDNGGKWEIKWLSEGSGDSKQEFSLPHEFVYENSLSIECNKNTIDTTIVYADTYQSYRLTFFNDGLFKSRIDFIDLDPVAELSNCNNIHFRNTQAISTQNGNWNYDSSTNTLTWQVVTYEFEGIIYYLKVEGTIVQLSNDEFILSGTASSFDNGNATPLFLPCVYKIKKFSVK